MRAMLVDVSEGERDLLRCTGVAYIVEVGDVERADVKPFVGYWETEFSDKLVVVEKDSWDSYDEALEWGLERADIVVMTTQDGRTTLYHFN